MGRFDADHASESGIRALREIGGRVSGLLKLADGRQINCIFWNHLFKEYPEIYQFQVVVRPDRSLKLLLQGAGFSADREAQISRTLENSLGPKQAQICWAPQIPLTKQGKRIQVVHETSL